jgi:hypothetical protein
MANVGQSQARRRTKRFLEFTSQQILKILRNENSPMTQAVEVNAKDFVLVGEEHQHVRRRLPR